MLVKLFKHDFKALSRWLLPVMIGIGGAAAIGFLNMLLLGFADGGKLDPASPATERLTRVSVMGTVLISVALASAATVIVVLIFVRFYKSMVTDEAYLTFTLPVTAGRLILSKFLAAMLWMLIGAVTIAAAGWVILSGALISGGYELREIAGDVFSSLAELIGENAGMVLLLCLYAVSGAVRSYFQVTCAILFGSSVVRRYKALVALAMILGFNLVVNTVLSIIGFSAGLMPLLLSTAYESVDAALFRYLWTQIAVNALVTAAFWIWSVFIAKKSVNIE